jgi:DNA-binding transcriptional LysR family regulator
MAITLERLRAFCAVVDSGSFTAAARQLVTSKAAVSSHVKALEAHCGVQLLRRELHGVKLTSEGQAFYDLARHILQDLDRLERLTARLTTRRHIVLGWAPSAAKPNLFADILRRLGSGSQVSIRFAGSHDIAERVRRGELDAGVVAAAAAPDLASMPVLADRIVLAASMPGVTLDDPDRCPAILVYSEDCCMYRQLVREYPQLRGRLVVINDLFIIKQGVLAGYGVSFLPRWCIESELQAGILFALPVSNTEHTMRWSLIFPYPRDSDTTIRPYSIPAVLGAPLAC